MTKKFNVIDILIIAAVAVAVAGAAFIKKGGVEPEEDGKKLITLEITEKHTGFSENVVVGDSVTEKVHKKQIGTVVGVKKVNSEKNSYDRASGKPTVTVIPEREDVYVTMEVSSDTEAYVGKPLSVITKHFAGSGYVTAVDYTEGGASE